MDFMKKLSALLLALLIMLSAAPIKAEGNSEWVKENGTYYYYENGQKKTGWFTDSYNNTYYFDPSTGAMKTGWLKQNFDWYYFDYTGILHKGWLSLGDKKYYLREKDGKMVVGMRPIGKTMYIFNYPNGYLEEENPTYNKATSSIVKKSKSENEKNYLKLDKDYNEIINKVLGNIDKINAAIKNNDAHIVNEYIEYLDKKIDRYENSKDKSIDQFTIPSLCNHLKNWIVNSTKTGFDTLYETPYSLLEFEDIEEDIVILMNNEWLGTKTDEKIKEELLKSKEERDKVITKANDYLSQFVQKK